MDRVCCGAAKSGFDSNYESEMLTSERCAVRGRGRMICAGDVAGEESVKVQKLKFQSDGRFDLFFLTETR